MKEISLTQGRVAIVDDCDFEFLSQWKWYAFKDKKTWYAKRNVTLLNGKQTGVLMHRVIMRSKQDEQVDHRDGNGLNNARSNLRSCTHRQNTQNIHFQSNNTSGYKGVRWHTQRHKWQAFIKVNYKQIHLGLFESPDDAAIAYDKAARHYFGEFSHCNFEQATEANNESR